jgi:hypothetical protein
MATAKLKLSGAGTGKYALVDEEDFPQLSRWSWYLTRPYGRHQGGYVLRSSGGKKFLLHRVVTDAPLDLVVDHRNFNKLDNRKSNLRVCTNKLNSAHRRSKQKNNTTGFVGVRRAYNGRGYSSDKWMVFVAHKYRGRFPSKKEAAEEYNRVARKMYGEFAFQNSL